MTEETNTPVKKPYSIKVFLTDFAGYIEYGVDTPEQVMVHTAAIVAGGYRHIDDRGNFIWYPVHRIHYVQATGPNLGSQYYDQAVRT